MTRVSTSQLTLSIGAVALGLLLLQPRLACAQQSSSPAPANAGPSLESVYDTFAFVRWSTPNPGGTILHFGVVQYGTDPNHLDMKAESPTRINPAHPDMIFRVSINDLLPGTTYYYKVSSRQADGISDPAPKVVSQFTTRSTNQMNAKK
jgi:hypothetical protein